jgi:transposase
LTTLTVPFGLPDCTIDAVHVDEELLTISAHSTRRTSPCPTCGTQSASVHSYYTRTLRDVPISNQPIRLLFTLRRLRCRNLSCPRRTFAEPIPAIAPVFARRTVRFTAALQQLGFSNGGEAGARLGTRLALPTSPDTLLRVVHRSLHPQALPPRVVGVDDWALTKGRDYAAILVDLERRRPIDLLPDRTAGTLAAWLRERPGIEVIARDRSTEFARGATEGAPQAQQVADRWHLLVNLREAIERWLNRVAGRLAGLPLDEQTALLLAQQEAIKPHTLRPQSQRSYQAQQAHRERRYARYEQARALYAEGVSILQIAKRVGLSWTTARNFAYAATFPERARQPRRSSHLDPYLSYLMQRWQAGCTNASQLWRELAAQGYGGTRKPVARWVQHQRTQPARTTPTKFTHADDTRPLAAQPARQRSRGMLPSPRELVWVLVREPTQLDELEHKLLSHLKQDAEAVVVHDLVQRYQTMIRKRQPDQLDPWLSDCTTSTVTELKTFAGGIERDKAAVSAAMSERWSTGPVEGHITRLKLLKRQAYGRASLGLLRQRLLAPA